MNAQSEQSSMRSTSVAASAAEPKERASASEARAHGADIEACAGNDDRWKVASPRQSLAAILNDIQQHDRRLVQRFHDRMVALPWLSRRILSDQANRARPAYRWFPFKEAFSAELAEYLLLQCGVDQGVVIDPFAGSGTTLFVAQSLGLDAEGIEALPLGQEIVAVRTLLADCSPEDIERLRAWACAKPWRNAEIRFRLPDVRIARGAYPEPTMIAIQQYMSAALQENARLQSILRFALLCVLEAISFTRKDGQYLRWDYRSGRAQGKKPFDKGAIPTLDEAVSRKIEEIANEAALARQRSLFDEASRWGTIRLYGGSCLHVLPTLPASAYDALITSPPYCNRYDYTRIYALELALLGVDDHTLARLRQDMLTCTVENRTKDLVRINPSWTRALAAAESQELLQTTLALLEAYKREGRLNNPGIPRMVRGYFNEMACVIAECARVLKPGALACIVIDNVRYASVSVSADLILSAIAETLGFHTERILIAADRKGNSSQQMRAYGREALRKSILCWRKR